MRALLSLMLLLTLVGCGQGVEDLGTFPCGKVDKTCPQGFICAGTDTGSANACIPLIPCNPSLGGGACKDHLSAGQGRCAYVLSGPGVYSSLCVGIPVAAKNEGEACGYRGQLSGFIDACANGLACVPYGMAASAGVCRKICTANGQCPGMCANYGFNDAFGACPATPVCSLSSGCAGSTTCGVMPKLGAPNEVVLDCVPSGGVDEGVACGSTGPYCKPGLWCYAEAGVTQRTCRKACDAGTHTCSSAPASTLGNTCQMIPSLGLGYCKTP